MTKPCITPDDAVAYRAIAALPEGAEVELDGTKAKFIGMTGHLITLQHKGRRIVYLRQGDPRIRDLAASLTPGDDEAPE